MEGECHSRAAESKRPYVVTRYTVSDDGKLEVDRPSQAPCGRDGKPCRIHRHSERQRKTGIHHKLVVIRCAAHGCCWTLYPPGFAPFLRRPLTSAAGWASTLFVAAWVAAQGKAAWPRRQRNRATRRPWWRTQTRHIARAALILGLLDGDDRPAQLLGVFIHDAHDAIAQFKAAGGFRARARAIVAILDKVELHDIERNLRRAAHQMGALGRAFEVQAGGLHPV